MSIITIIDSGADFIKKLKIIGHTTKYAKAMPVTNKKIVDVIKGRTKLFSFLYSPGAIKSHI